MPDPILNKPTEAYTIADCEYYLGKYPYGERAPKVKIRLKQLRREAEANSLQEPKASPQEIAEVVTTLAEHAQGKNTQSHVPSPSTPVEEEYEDDEMESAADEALPTDSQQATYTPTPTAQSEGSKIFWGCIGWIVALACGAGVAILIKTLWEGCPNIPIALAGVSVARGIAELFDLPGRNGF